MLLKHFNRVISKVVKVSLGRAAIAKDWGLHAPYRWCLRGLQGVIRSELITAQLDGVWGGTSHLWLRGHCLHPLLLLQDIVALNLQIKQDKIKEITISPHNLLLALLLHRQNEQHKSISVATQPPSTTQSPTACVFNTKSTHMTITTKDQRLLH